jgi:hypothetical protein
LTITNKINISKVIKSSCDEEWGDTLIDILKKKQIKGLCEEGPSIGSKINCYDSDDTIKLSLYRFHRPNAFRMG